VIDVIGPARGDIDRLQGDVHTGDQLVDGDMQIPVAVADTGLRYRAMRRGQQERGAKATRQQPTDKHLFRAPHHLDSPPALRESRLQV
jgi:hypothetical protein